ncbi:MAG: hypothetical protein Fur0023_17040 [Bacteroidia bacterium]
MVKTPKNIIYLLFITYSVAAQNENGQYFLGTRVQSMPIYVNNKNGGFKELYKFINQNLIYPQSAIKDSLEGNVYVSFIVTEAGTTCNHKVLKGIRNDLDSEAIRVVRLLKFEKPAIQNGKPVKYEYHLKIPFHIRRK